MYTGNLDTLGMIHDIQWIDIIISRYFPAYEIKTPDKTWGNG
jgi:hypothetical protein